MITFAEVKKPKVKSTQIPAVIDFNHKFILYACDEPVGVTYGSFGGKLELHLPNGKKIEFSVDDLKRIQKRKINALNFVKYGLSK